MIEQQTALTKLKMLASLPKGWNYGSGVPLTPNAYKYGVLALHYLSSVGAGRLDVLPTECGGATILASKESDTAEIIVGGDGQFDLFLDRPHAPDMALEGINFGDVVSALEDAGWQSLKSSGSHIRVFTVESTEDSPVRHFETKALARQSLTRRALWNRVGQFVTISTDTTKDWEEPHQFFGGCKSRPLVLAHG
jgi:hypothetical protein